MIWIIGGSSEAREIIERIQDLDNFLVTIATEGGREFFDTKNLFVGRLDYGQMKYFCRKNEISLIVDLTHPYARIVSENASQLAKEMGIAYIRYNRPKTEMFDCVVSLGGYGQAYEYLKDLDGTVFFTTGSKNIGDFEKVRGRNRFIYRVLPSVESLEICRAHNISMRDIVALLGPFSKEYNLAMLKEYKPDYCMMKDSGDRGGCLEKIQACQELNIIPLVIGREEEEGISSLEEIEKLIRKAR